MSHIKAIGRARPGATPAITPEHGKQKQQEFEASLDHIAKPLL